MHHPTTLIQQHQTRCLKPWKPFHHICVKMHHPTSWILHRQTSWPNMTDTQINKIMTFSRRFTYLNLTFLQLSGLVRGTLIEGFWWVYKGSVLSKGTSILLLMSWSPWSNQSWTMNWIQPAANKFICLTGMNSFLVRTLQHQINKPMSTNWPRKFFKSLHHMVCTELLIHYHVDLYCILIKVVLVHTSSKKAFSLPSIHAYKRGKFDWRFKNVLWWVLSSVAFKTLNLIIECWLC